MSFRNSTMSAAKERIRLETGYSGRKGELADEATKHAIEFLMYHGDEPVPLGAPSGLTQEAWMRSRTEDYVRKEMGAFWFSFILGPIISAVVQAIIELWFNE